MSLILRVPWSGLLAPFIHQSPSQSQAFVSDIHRWRWRLVEQTEAHVVVGLLLLLLLGGLGGGLGGTTSGGSTAGRGGGTRATRGNGGELLRAGLDQLEGTLVACCVGASHLCDRANFAESVSAYLVDVLALELLKEGREALLVGVNANRAEDGLNVLGRGGGVAGQAEEEVSCHVLHLDGVCRNALVGCGCGRVAAGCSLTVGWFG
jgi:hypothetical protein